MKLNYTFFLFATIFWALEDTQHVSLVDKLGVQASPFSSAAAGRNSAVELQSGPDDSSGVPGNLR